MKSLAQEVGRLGQTVLVLQGGGALGAYQVGVYEALHEAGIDARLGDRHVDRRHQCRRSSPAASRTNGSKNCASSGRAFRTTI